MKTLIFAAHGSRKKESNDEVIIFFQNIINLLDGVFDDFICCFLEFKEPFIEQAVKTAVEKGADEIYIFPYFLFNGTHVTVDIPEIVAKFKDKNIKVLKSLGSIDGFDGFIAEYLKDEMGKQK